MKLREKCTKVIMWISRLVCRLSRRSSNKFAAMSKWAKKPQEALDRHAARLVKERQALVSFGCYDSPSRIKRRASLSDAVICDNQISSEDKNSRLPAHRNSHCTPLAQRTVVPHRPMPGPI